MSLNPVDTAFELNMRACLPAAVFRDLNPRYLEEPRGLFHGQGGLLMAPSCVEEVAAIVSACAKAKIGIVPYGGGTGLVGGQVQPSGPGPVVLSMERMRKVRSVHPNENVIVAEAGVIIADLQEAAQSSDRLFPLSLASEGSCQVGGVLSTNAGGVNVLRYGNARDLCLGLEAVLPDGSIWHGLKRLRKDNTGYDLRGLLCGAEGTLGVITAASLRLFPRPVEVATAVLVVTDPAAALELLALAQGRMGQALSAFELISGVGMQFLAETECVARAPFEELPEWAVLVELGFGPDQNANAAMEALYEAGDAAGLLTDGVIASSNEQRTKLWAMRESIPEANKRLGTISSHDISLPLSRIPEFIQKATQMIARLGPFRVNAFGHLGDGNLHFNVFAPKGSSRAEYLDVKSEIRDLVYDLVQDFDGSFSAEHGIGRLKIAEMERYGDPVKLTAMRSMKRALDPLGIMNPGAVLSRDL